MVTVDSGSADTVGPKSVGKASEVKETEASRKGLTYRTANNQPVPNEGEKRIMGWTDEWEETGITIQVANVKKVLASVSRICDAGNRVVFEGKGGYIQNVRTGKRTDLKQVNGCYTFDMWVELAKEYEKEGDDKRVEMDFVGLGATF